MMRRLLSFRHKPRIWLRKWLGIDEIEALAARADLRAMGYDPDDPHLSYKLQMKLKAAHEAGYSAGRGDERKCQEQNQGYAVEAVEQLKKSVATFEEKSGIRIDRYSGGRLGEAVAAFMQIRGEHHARAVEHSIESCSRSMDALKAFRAALGEMEKATVPDTC